MAVLNSVIEFGFRSGARHTIGKLNNKAYWIKNKSQMNGNCYSLKSLKQAVKYLVEKDSFIVGSQRFLQIISIAMGSDTVPFFSNPFFSRISKMKNIDHHRAKRFGHVYRFIDDLT